MRRSKKFAARWKKPEKLREEAQSLLANYQRQQRQAMQDAENIVARAKEEAVRHRAEADEAMKEMGSSARRTGA